MAAAAHGHGPHRRRPDHPVPVRRDDPASHHGHRPRRAESMSAITTIAVLPVLTVVLTTTLQLGSLRVVASRIGSAADLAALVAVNDQDDAELARSGRLVPSA